MEKEIRSIDKETLETIKNRSAYKLPTNPSERGYKAQEIKDSFWKAQFDGEMSIMGQIIKLIERLNQILPQLLDNSQIVDNYTTSDSTLVASANQLVKLKALIDENKEIIESIGNELSDANSTIDIIDRNQSNQSILIQENATDIDALTAELNKVKNGSVAVSVKKADGTMGQITQDSNGYLWFEGKAFVFAGSGDSSSSGGSGGNINNQT